MVIRIGSLFSGAGGLDMAVERFFGGRTVWHSEIDPAASKVLAHRWPDVPNLGDINAVDWSTTEAIDILCGGFPCQDVSAAGRRAGIAAGTRSGLWLKFANAIGRLRPQIVVIENVRGLLSGYAHRAVESVDLAVGDRAGRPVLRAAGAVLGDLADLGYDAQWVTVSAASVGAPHKRERVFVLAHPARQPWIVDDGDRLRTGRGAQRSGPSTGFVRGSDAAVGGDGPVDLLPTPAASRSGNNQSASPGAAVRPSLDSITDLLPTPNAQDGNGGRYNSRGHQATLPGTVRVFFPTPTSRDHKGGNPNRDDELCYLPTPAAADGQRGPDFARAGRDGSGGDDLVTLCAKATHDTQWGKYGPAIACWEALTCPAPLPTEPNTRGNPRLAAEFPEWMQGWPDGWVTDLVALGLISRNDALRIIGNGVCPQQALAALWQLDRISQLGVVI
jgi:site-specific DNA-cytosine methylase